MFSLDYQFTLQAETTPDKKPVFQSKIGHLCRCENHASQCYMLVFNYSELKKLAPSNLKIGTYTTDTMKIVVSCQFYLVHLDTMKIQEVTLYVAKYDGSALLPFTTTLVLGLIKPHT